MCIALFLLKVILMALGTQEKINERVSSAEKALKQI